MRLPTLSIGWLFGTWRVLYSAFVQRLYRRTVTYCAGRIVPAFSENRYQYRDLLH